MVVLITTKLPFTKQTLVLMNYEIFFYYRSHSKALEIISSPFCSVSALQFLYISHDGMRIHVIHYEPLTLSLRLSNLFFFFQQSH